MQLRTLLVSALAAAGAVNATPVPGSTMSQLRNTAANYPFSSSAEADAWSQIAPPWVFDVRSGIGSATKGIVASFPSQFIYGKPSFKLSKTAAPNVDMRHLGQQLVQNSQTDAGRSARTCFAVPGYGDAWMVTVVDTKSPTLRALAKMQQPNVASIQSLMDSASQVVASSINSAAAAALSAESLKPNGGVLATVCLADYDATRRSYRTTGRLQCQYSERLMVGIGPNARMTSEDFEMMKAIVQNVLPFWPERGYFPGITVLPRQKKGNVDYAMTMMFGGNANMNYRKTW